MSGEKRIEAAAVPPPHVQLIEMGMAHWISRMVYTAAQLRLCDHLAKRPQTAEELSEPTGTHAPSLYRFLRTLAGLGMMTEDGAHRFSLTPMGEALREGAPGAARATILTMASEWWARGFEQLLYSLQTGQSGFEKMLGMPVFDWLAQNPAEASMFSQTMIGVHGGEPPAVAAAYDFSQFATIVDVGGATGHLLTTILQKHARPRGVLFDLPHVVREAPSLIESRGLAGRVTIDHGSFFERVPHGSDAYLLSHIIHDWSEEQCLKILDNCRRAMNQDGRLLLIEMVLPHGNEPHPGKILDIMMLVGPGGRERTEPEYRDLLGKAGFHLNKVIPTASPVSIVEASRS